MEREGLGWDKEREQETHSGGERREGKKVGGEIVIVRECNRDGEGVVKRGEVLEGTWLNYNYLADTYPKRLTIGAFYHEDTVQKVQESLHKNH